MLGEVVRKGRRWCFVSIGVPKPMGVDPFCDPGLTGELGQECLRRRSSSSVLPEKWRREASPECAFLR